MFKYLTRLKYLRLEMIFYQTLLNTLQDCQAYSKGNWLAVRYVYAYRFLTTDIPGHMIKSHLEIEPVSFFLYQNVQMSVMAWNLTESAQII